MRIRSLLFVGALAGTAYAAFRALKPRTSTPAAPHWEPGPFPFPPVPRPSADAAPHHVHVPTGVDPLAGPETDPIPSAPAADAVEPLASPVLTLAVAAWVEPEAGGACPSTHPVKAKLSSGIFHVPGGLSYARTVPDRCYRDEAAALADGLRPSKL